MNTNTFTRRITSAMSGPIVAAGIILGSMVIGDDATATAQPTSAGQWAGMTLTDALDSTKPVP